AELLANIGYTVSGSDLNRSATTERLVSLGCTVFNGHHGDHIDGADVVVASSAISPENPEITRARELNIPVVMRAEMLAELMRLKKYGIAIAGSHGKTSTTSMVSWVMAQAGLDPTIVVGGKVDCLGGNAKLGESDYLVAEADESDGSFLKLSPILEVITNIDFEHPDYYEDIDQVKNAFLQFIDKIPFYGAAIICLDDEHLAEIMPQIGKRIITYGLSRQADLYGENLAYHQGRSRFDVFRGGEMLGQVALLQPGQHNVYNALATIAVGLELEIDFSTIAKALERFAGVQRRLELKGEAGGVTVIDDYGHHPTEIRATLNAVKQAWPEKRLVVLFQPHPYSRTKGLFNEFQTCFHQADYLVMTDIYAASEQPIEGIDSLGLLEKIKQHGQRQTAYISEVEQLAAAVKDELRPGDLVLTLGAGNIVRA
ncbi:MAG: UDP-N-acetylmuramate--L-alanine ligase, partial [Desulfofustis sp.]